jgi:hypothetical protein
MLAIMDRSIYCCTVCPSLAVSSVPLEKRGLNHHVRVFVFNRYTAVADIHYTRFIERFCRSGMIMNRTYDVSSITLVSTRI